MTSLNPFRSVFGAVMFSCMAILAVAGLKSFRDLGIAKERETQLEQRIAETEANLDHLRDRVELLRDDPATLERLARENHGMVKEGELVIVLPDE